MKFSRTYTLSEVAQLIDAEYVGEENFPVFGINEIHVVEEGDIVFVDHPKYYDKALESAATIVLINKKVDCPEGKALLISENPFSDFNKITKHFYQIKKSTELQSPNAKIGKNTHIQPNVFIGNNVSIGDNCFIHANVVINDDTQIGDNVIIHSGTVLGADAFYYKNRTTHFEKLHSCGFVSIENNVEIGALCTIDRGVTGVTTIGEHTKIDNQVQIGHDTIIGKRCLFAAQVGIAGCVVVEDEVTLWGQVGIASGIKLGKGSTLLAQAGTNKSTESSKVYFGSPAGEARVKFKEVAAVANLPYLIKKLNSL